MSKLILSALILLSLASFFVPLSRILRQVKQAKGKLSWGPFGARFRRFLGEVLLQSKVIRDRPLPGLMHAFVFWGFLAFSLETLDHFFRGYGVSFLGHGPFHKVFGGFVAGFAILVLIGILYLAFRRFILRPQALGKFSPGSFAVAVFIVVLMVTYLASYFTWIDPQSTAAKWNWWIHTIVILAFLGLIPHSKHMHLALSPFTTFSKDFRIARIKPLDFENEEFGAEKVFDLDAHTILAAYTCVECGRCMDHCPANQTGKTLNPKEFILNLRKSLKEDVEKEVIGNTVSSEIIWQCTTCGACTTQCPVGVEHVTPLIEFRRGLVAEGNFPSPMGNLFKGLEGAGKNPWSYERGAAEDFISKNAFPLFKDQSVLYWMGCMGRYDAQYQKTALSFAKLLNKAGVSWGVLKEESCTGDAARRAGNEFLFQQLAEENIALLNEAKPTTIVSTCPHCLATLEEYEDMGLNRGIEFIHHTSFLNRLMEQGKLKVKTNESGSVVYHDACYLSRYRGKEGIEAPRSVLKTHGAELKEASRNGSKSFCCGAGGAMLFTEETQGKRINHERTDELVQTGAKNIATSCPFCQMMVRDGATDREYKNVTVKDIADILAE